MAALPSRRGHYIFALWFLLLSSFLFPRLISAIAEWMSTILLYTWCGLSANLELRSEMCCTLLAGNTGRKNHAKIAIWAPSCNFVGLNLRNQGMYRQSEKNLLNSMISSTCPHNMATFGPLAAEICWRVSTGFASW